MKAILAGTVRNLNLNVKKHFKIIFLSKNKDSTEYSDTFKIESIAPLLDLKKYFLISTSYLFSILLRVTGRSCPPPKILALLHFRESAILRKSIVRIG